MVARLRYHELSPAERAMLRSLLIDLTRLAEDDRIPPSAREPGG
jgi:hypothetical protein